MMLRALLPRLPQRYAVVGSAIGAILPLIGFSAEFLLAGSDGSVLARLGEPVHALMMTVPLLTGLMSYQYGLSVEALCRRLSVRERAERNLISLSLHDRLTGLPNRLALEKEIERFIAMGPRDDFKPVLLLLDLNKFKHVNDTLGHDAGDELLRQFTNRLKQTLGPLTRLFRLGGDEFVVTLSGRPHEQDIERLCLVIEAQANDPFQLSAGRAVTGVSIGISYLETEDRVIADILKRADLALYIAKDAADSAHAFHTEGLGRFMEAQSQLGRDIGLALQQDAFFLEYQPIVNAASGQVQAFEALVRWRHPQGGVVLPESFLPVAIQAGHIAALGRWIIAQAIADAAAWPAPIGLAVNVSAEELRDPGFVGHIGDCLDRFGLAAHRLTIEITEASLLGDAGSLPRRLGELRSRGVRIALDDFGIGLSTMNLLRQFPVDFLKVDRSFTRAMLDGGREAELVDIIIKLGQVFDMPTTVEGVENERQMHMALSLGASAVQGYLISQPVPAGEIAHMLIAARRVETLEPEIRSIA